MPQIDHICVCICTYQRPHLLIKLLVKLEEQETEGKFNYSVVIVDNEKTESARTTVQSFAQLSKLSISYYVEKEQNIALARNKAIENAKGDLIAFIDDDEFPDTNWLLNLHRSHNKYNADGILGPVKPYFEIEPPGWIIKGKLCERDSFATGTILTDSKYTRTGNVLLAKRIFTQEENKFDLYYGKTGGEDTDFFKRMIEKGYAFLWCNEAIVYETVPLERFKRTYFLKRALMRGVVNSKNISLLSYSAIKSLVAFLLYSAALPFFSIIGHHLFMKYLIKNCDHIGKLLSICGIKVIKERTL